MLCEQGLTRNRTLKRTNYRKLVKNNDDNSVFIHVGQENVPEYNVY